VPGPVMRSGSGAIEIEFAARRRCRLPERSPRRRIGPSSHAGRWTACHCRRRAGVDCDLPHRHGPRHELTGVPVLEAFRRAPHGDDLYVFRGKSCKLIKARRPKRLERGRSVWPSLTDGVMTIPRLSFAA